MKTDNKTLELVLKIENGRSKMLNVNSFSFKALRFTAEPIIDVIKHRQEHLKEPLSVITFWLIHGSYSIVE